MYCGGLCSEGSMVYVGIHVKWIAMDLRETLQGKAELYPATWAAFQVLEKAIAEEMPADRPKRKQGYEGKPRRCVWSKAEQTTVFNIRRATFVGRERLQRLRSRWPPRARKKARYSG